MPDIIQSLWIGPRLSPMERLVINSYLENGHEFHLYTYDQVHNIPFDTVIRDANQIIPRNKVFTVRKGYSSFSDFFRWKLVLDRGGYWVDLDAVCLKPFDFDQEYVFIGGRGGVGSNDCITSGIFKAPIGSDIMRAGWEACQNMDLKKMGWGDAGPPLFTRLVHEFGFLDTIIPGRLFFPFFHTGAPRIFLIPGVQIPEEVYSLHFFNEMWSQAKQTKEGVFPATCVYEQLKRKYGA